MLAIPPVVLSAVFFCIHLGLVWESEDEFLNLVSSAKKFMRSSAITHIKNSALKAALLETHVVPCCRIVGDFQNEVIYIKTLEIFIKKILMCFHSKRTSDT